MNSGTKRSTGMEHRYIPTHLEPLIGSQLLTVVN
jgi:hypothetical protein